MIDRFSEIRDMIAVVGAEIDRAQANLDHARVRFPNPTPEFKKTMDETQIRLDSQREQLAAMRKVQDFLEE